MTKSVQSYLEEITSLTEELDPLYPPNDVDNSTDLTIPDTFIPASQKVQMNVLLDTIQSALLNTYTTNSDEQEQLGEYLFTVEMRSEQLSAVSETYNDLSRFYRDSVRPFVTKVTEFITNAHTPIHSHLEGSETDVQVTE